MALHRRSAGARRAGAVHRARRRGREVAVELAAAAAFRLAPDHVLAGARTAGAVPDPLRRILDARRLGPPCADPPSHRRSHGGSRRRALGEDDAGRAGTIPAAPARPVRLRSGRRVGVRFTPMKARLLSSVRVALVITAIVALPTAAIAQINVITSGGFSAAFREILPDFERTTGISVTTT